MAGVILPELTAYLCGSAGGGRMVRACGLRGGAIRRGQTWMLREFCLDGAKRPTCSEGRFGVRWERGRHGGSLGQLCRPLGQTRRTGRGHGAARGSGAL